MCTKDRSESLLAALASVVNVDYPHFEIIIVDQSANSATACAIEPLLSDTRIRYIRTDTVGKGRACNIALAEARGEIVAYTDDDCTVPRDWLTQLVAAFAQDPQISLVFCNVTAGEHDTSKGYIPAFEVRENKIIRRLKETLNGIGLGAGMAVKREALQKVGGFDNSLGPGARFKSGEDHDIAVRLLLEGHWLYQTRDTHVVHYGFRSWSEGRAHTRRDLFSCGAFTVKPLKCGRVQGMWMFASKPVLYAFYGPFDDLLHLRKPRGFMRGFYFVEGVLAGLKTPVHTGKILFQE
jgi:GT2 family glycosyltransferase